MSWRIACFCGWEYEDEPGESACPSCGEPTPKAQVSEAEGRFATMMEAWFTRTEIDEALA